MNAEEFLTLEWRVRQWLQGEPLLIRVHWESDGRLLLRLLVESEGDRLRWTWLEEEPPFSVRRERITLSEIERLVSRQLLEPAGERLFLYRNSEQEPAATLRVFVGAGDYLQCLWE